MNSYPEISSDQPTSFKIPLRSLLSVVTLLSIGYNGWLIYECSKLEDVIWIVPVMACILDALPLIALISDNLTVIRISRGLVILSVVYAVVNFCIWPVFLSGIDGDHLLLITDNKLRIGYFAEGLIGLEIIIQLTKFYLINRLYKFIRANGIADNVSFATITDL